MSERTWRVFDTKGVEHAARTTPGKEPVYQKLDGYHATVEYADRHGYGGRSTACAWDHDERRAVVQAALNARIELREVLDCREKSAAEQLTAATAEIARLQAALVRVDDPEADATDFAHPAWWRGHDHVARMFKQQLDKARAEANAFLEKCDWMRAELDPLTRRAESAEAVANEAMRVGRETCALLDEERRGLEDQVRYLDDSRQEARAEIERLTKHVAGLEAAARLHQDALTIERRPEQVIVTLRDGDRMWSADGADLADALASIVRAMRGESTDDHTMRRARPTVPEVRALAKLWPHHDGCAFVLLRVLSPRMQLVTMHVASVIVEADGLRVDGYAAADMDRLDRSEGWLPLCPDGLVTRSELERLAAGEAR